MNLSLDKAAFTRASEAWNPHTGERVGINVLRRNPPRARLCNFRPNQVYHTFPESTTRMTYSELLTRMDEFEGNIGTAVPVTKSILGQSYQSRDVVCYRIGDENKPKLMFITGVHGNEVDGTEGMFAILEDLINGVHPELSPILEQHSILWIVSANPDGWAANLRNLASIGPNGKTVNLNRCFPFFWDPYTESSAESKGAAPAGLPGAAQEAQLIYDLVIAEAAEVYPLRAVFDHHENIGQGHRYLSRNRVNSFNSDWQNRDFDVLRLQGSIRKQRGDSENLFCQFRRSKNVPHLHSWVSGSVGLMSMALESRKDEPTGHKGNCEWMYDSTLACLVTMTDAFWTQPETVQIEREATNLITQVGWDEWASIPEGNAAPSGFVRSRISIDPSTQVLFPHNANRTCKVTALLAVDPSEPSSDWQCVGLGDVVIAVGRFAGSPALQTMRLATETVSTGPGASATSPSGATRNYGMVYHSSTAGRVYGGWADDGLLIYNDGFEVDGTTGVFGAVIPGALPIDLADMGYASDGSRYSVFVGGSTGAITDPFVSALSNKILLYDANSGTWSDTGLTIPARKHACVVHQIGTDNFWIFGGEDSSGDLYDDIWVYDRAGVSVTESSTTLPSPMSHISGSGWGTNLIYLYGGITQASSFERDTNVRSFVPSTETLTTETVLANLEDEASHDETPWATPLSGVAVGRLSGDGDLGDIFIIGGQTGTYDSSEDQLEIYSHRPDSNTLTFARDGTYGLFSRGEDLLISPGDWISTSSWGRSTIQGGLAYHRNSLTFKTSGGSWTGHHARTYYEVPFYDKWQWFRTAGPAKAGDAKVRPYLRNYVHEAEIIYDRLMVSARSRASSYHETTREAETLTFSEQLAMNNLKLRFYWNPTFGFINVGEDLELARIQIDANNYISLVAMEGNGTDDKVYHSGNALIGPRYPQVELRKVRNSVLESTLSLTLYYGYDCRSSNQEAYDDPVEFEIEHVANGRFTFGIWRYGILGRTEDRTATSPFDSLTGQLIYNGEGEYGIPEVINIRSYSDPAIDGAVRELSTIGSIEQDCIHPGEPDAQ